MSQIERLKAKRARLLNQRREHLDEMAKLQDLIDGYSKRIDRTDEEIATLLVDLSNKRNTT